MDAIRTDQRNTTQTATRDLDSQAARTQTRGREGLVLGLTLAIAVSAWDLAVDVLAGQSLLFAPLVGRGIASLFGMSAGLLTAALAWYMAFHLAVFLAAGIAIERVLALGERHHFVIVFGVVSATYAQIAVVGVAAILAEGPIGSSAWVTVPGSALLGLMIVALHVRRRHAGLRRALVDADDTDDWA